MIAPASSYASGVSDVPLLGDTIGENFDRTVTAFPDREALVDCAVSRRWTYRRLAGDVDACARGLHARGIGKGDRVGLWSPNRAEWTIVQFATAKLGAILVGIDPSCHARELEYVLNQAGVRMLIAAPSRRGRDHRAVVTEVRSRCPDLYQVVFFDDQAWDDLLTVGRAGDPGLLPRIAGTLSSDDPIGIQYTSGTTGLPKGVTLSHHGTLNNGRFVADVQHRSPGDRICLPVPFHHCFGMVLGGLGAVSHGSCIVIPSPEFDPAATLWAMQGERCTAVHGTPAMFAAMLNEPDFAAYDLSGVRTGVMAGAPCPAEVMKRVMEDMGVHGMTVVYGLAETSPAVAQTRVMDGVERRTSTVGTVLPHLEIKIVDPVTGVTVPRGAPGELCVRGYSVMLGYWEQPDRTAEVIDAARWMHTGDLAAMDEEGYVSIVGRVEDMTVHGGEDLGPHKIEEFLHARPGIVDAQVIELLGFGG